MAPVRYNETMHLEHMLKILIEICAAAFAEEALHRVKFDIRLPRVQAILVDRQQRQALFNESEKIVRVNSKIGPVSTDVVSLIS